MPVLTFDHIPLRTSSFARFLQKWTNYGHVVPVISVRINLRFYFSFFIASFAPLTTIILIKKIDFKLIAFYTHLCSAHSSSRHIWPCLPIKMTIKCTRLDSLVRRCDERILNRLSGIANYTLNLSLFCSSLVCHRASASRHRPLICLLALVLRIWNICLSNVSTAL